MKLKKRASWWKYSRYHGNGVDLETLTNVSFRVHFSLVKSKYTAAAVKAFTRNFRRLSHEVENSVFVRKEMDAKKFGTMTTWE